jgi:hypothetical protein
MNTEVMTQQPLPLAALHALGLSATSVHAPGVSPLETPEGKVWVKTVEPQTKRLRRLALEAIGRILPFPILRPSKTGKGGDTLLLQAHQIGILCDAKLPVPHIYFSNRDFLILADAGATLDLAIKYDDARADLGLPDEELENALLTMTNTLALLHSKGFAHGRPKIRDFGWQDGTATLLDLEERPWEVMPMTTAQARDVFLWIMDLSGYRYSRRLAPQAMTRLLETMSADTERELKKLMRLLAFAAPIARLLMKTSLSNREIGGSLAAYNVMKSSLTRKT